MAYHTTPIHLERRQLDNQLVDKRSGQPLAAFHVSPGVAELPLTDANLHMRRETEDARRGLWRTRIKDYRFAFPGAFSLKWAFRSAHISLANGAHQSVGTPAVGPRSRSSGPPPLLATPTPRSSTSPPHPSCNYDQLGKARNDRLGDQSHT